MKHQRIVTRTIATLASALLVAVIGCHGDTGTEPERFRYIQRVGQGSRLYQDTETGDLWMRGMGGFGADTWTRVDSRGD